MKPCPENNAPIAQLVERGAYNAEVVGSGPTGSILKITYSNPNAFLSRLYGFDSHTKSSLFVSLMVEHLSVICIKQTSRWRSGLTRQT